MSVSRLKTDPDARARTLVLSRFTPYRIVALGHAIGDHLGRAYEDENVSIKEWRVLAVIAQAEAVAARDVVRLTPMDKMSVSRAVSALESKGFVLRSVDQRDRRVNTVSLTPQGRELFARIAGRALAYEDRVLSVLSDDERRSFDKILSKLTSAAGAPGCD